MAHKSSDRHLSIIQVAIVLWMMAIGAKLLWLQVKQHDWLLARAAHQQQAAIDLNPMRGIITERIGHEPPRSAAVNSLSAPPAEVGDQTAAADKLANLLDVDRDELYKRLTSGRAAVAVKRKLDDEDAANVLKLGLPGLHFVNEMKRYY